MKRNAITREAKRIIKWNKKRFNRQLRHRKQIPTGKCGYRKTGFDARLHTMA